MESPLKNRNLKFKNLKIRKANPDFQKMGNSKKAEKETP
jgi:hypothetical protein